MSTNRLLTLTITSDIDMAREFRTRRQARAYADRRGIRGRIIRHPAYAGSPQPEGGFVIRDTDYRDADDLAFVQ